MTARDRDTGKEQQITISGSTQLSKEEIDRMVRDADAHRQEDQRRREEVEARNQADAIAYQVERRLQELGDAAPSHERARAEMLVTDARRAVADQEPVDRVQELTSELQQVLAGLNAVQAGSAGQADATVGAGAGSDDDVIDAEFDRS